MPINLIAFGFIGNLWCIPGLQCAAQYPQDDLWYRVVLREITRDLTSATVYFVDSGRIHLLPVSQYVHIYTTLHSVDHVTFYPCLTCSRLKLFCIISCYSALCQSYVLVSATLHSYSALCHRYSALCLSYSALCLSYSALCHSYSALCHSYSALCHSYSALCLSYSALCHSYSALCHSYSALCHSYSALCHSYSALCHSYSALCHSFLMFISQLRVVWLVCLWTG